MNNSRCNIRWCIRRDIFEVLEIEKQGFANPWSEDELLSCLRNRNCIAMVAEIGEKVVGYMIYELEKTRLNLIKLAVHSGYRRRGVGSDMILKLIGKLSGHRRPILSVTLRETNLGAQLFFKRLGLKAIRVVKNHFDDSGEDAYEMCYALPEAGQVGFEYQHINRVAAFLEGSR